MPQLDPTLVATVVAAVGLLGLQIVMLVRASRRERRLLAALAVQTGALHAWLDAGRQRTSHEIDSVLNTLISLHNRLLGELKTSDAAQREDWPKEMQNLREAIIEHWHSIRENDRKKAAEFVSQMQATAFEQYPTKRDLQVFTARRRLAQERRRLEAEKKD